MSRVVLHIDHLVLRGVRAEDRHRLAAGLRQELARMLAEPQTVQRLLETRGQSLSSDLRRGGIRVGPQAGAPVLSAAATRQMSGEGKR